MALEIQTKNVRLTGLKWCRLRGAYEFWQEELFGFQEEVSILLHALDGRQSFRFQPDEMFLTQQIRLSRVFNVQVTQV